MANIRKLWSTKTSLRGISSTEGAPDMVVPDYFVWSSDPWTSAAPVYRYYTGGAFDTGEVSPFLWSVKNTFYDTSPLSQYDYNYGEIQETDFTRWFRRSETIGGSADKVIPYLKGVPGFEAQITDGDPYYDITYGTGDSAVPSNFQKFFTGSFIQAIEDDDYSYATETLTLNGVSTKGYGWWYRNYEKSGSTLVANDNGTTRTPELVRHSSTVPGAYSLRANYYFMTWRTDTSGVWNEYEGASLTPNPQIPHLAKDWYSGTISDSEKAQMPFKGKPRLAAPKESGYDKYQAGGTNLAFEIELAVHRYGGTLDDDPTSTSVPGVGYYAGNFTFEKKGNSVLIPCYIKLEDREQSLSGQNFWGSATGGLSPIVARGHSNRYVVVALRLEQAYNVESYVPGSGCVADPERTHLTQVYSDENVSKGVSNSGLITDASGADAGITLYPRSNRTNVILNTGAGSNPVHCFRMSESGDQWFWTGGTHSSGSTATNKAIFRANAGSHTKANYYSSGPRNHLFLGTTADPDYYRLPRGEFTANWASTLEYVVPHTQGVVDYYKTTTSRVNYAGLALGFQIQAFQWSNDGTWLYILYTSGNQNNTSASSYVYQWVERYYSESHGGSGYGLNSATDLTGDGVLKWAGTTQVHYTFGDGDAAKPILYPAHSINVTPDGQYLQVLFDYFKTGYPTLSEHFLGGDPHAVQPPSISGEGFSRTTTPRAYAGYSTGAAVPETTLTELSEDDRIYWPVATVKPGSTAVSPTIPELDAGTTDVYLTMGTSYLTNTAYEDSFNTRASVGTGLSVTTKSYPTDFSWSVDGSTMYLFGFFDYALYADQFPDTSEPDVSMGSYGLWDIADGAPIMWKVSLYEFRSPVISDADLTKYPGVSPQTNTYSSPGGHQFLYNNRIYWNWKWHTKNKAAGLEPGGAPYSPAGNESYQQVVSMTLKKATMTYGGASTTQYVAAPIFTSDDVFMTVASTNPQSRQHITMVKNTVPYGGAAYGYGVTFTYRFDLSDSSLSGDGINVYDVNGVQHTQGVNFSGGAVGTAGSLLTITLDPSVGYSYPTQLYVYGTAASGPNDANNPGFRIQPRQLPLINFSVTNLTESDQGKSDIWPQTPIRLRNLHTPPPVSGGYSKHTDNSKHAVFNLAKNGRFINIACAVSLDYSGTPIDSSGNVQRISTWLIESYGDTNEQWSEINNSYLPPEQYIGFVNSGLSPIAPFTNRSRWGNSIHFSAGAGDAGGGSQQLLSYTAVWREYSIVPTNGQINLLFGVNGPTRSVLEQFSPVRSYFNSLTIKSTPRPFDFDFQAPASELAADSAYQNWPYVVAFTSQQDALACFNDMRGGRNSLWFVNAFRREDTNVGWRQSGLYYYGAGYYDLAYKYGPSPDMRRIPTSVTNYNELVATGEYLDTSETAVSGSYMDYTTNFRNFKFINGTSVGTNWQAGKTTSRIDVPPFKWQAQGLSRTEYLAGYRLPTSTLSYMDVFNEDSGGDFAVMKKQFNGPNLTTSALAWKNGGRVEYEIPNTFASYTDVTGSVSLETVVYEASLDRYDQLQVRSIRFEDGGRRFSVLVSGKLETVGSTNYGYPAFSLLMYNTTSPHSIENAVFDKSFTYSGVSGNNYWRTWWNSWRQFASTYYGSDFVFNSDGTKFWVIGMESSKTSFGATTPYQCKTLVYEYDLSSAWDLSTVSANGSATYANIAHSGSSFELPSNLEVSTDGTTVYWGTHTPQSSAAPILHYSSTLANPYDLKNPTQESSRPYSYQSYNGNIVSKGVPMYAHQGAGQKMRFVNNKSDRWYRTNFANPATDETTPAAPAYVTATYYTQYEQAYGGCSVFELDGRKYQKEPSKVSIGNMGMFPTRPFPSTYQGGVGTPYGEGRRSSVSFADMFLFAVDPSETTIVVGDGQRWLYQLLFNNDRGVQG